MDAASRWVPADAASTLLALRHRAAARCERAVFAVQTNSIRCGDALTVPGSAKASWV